MNSNMHYNVNSVKFIQKRLLQQIYTQNGAEHNFCLKHGRDTFMWLVNPENFLFWVFQTQVYPL